VALVAANLAPGVALGTAVERLRATLDTEVEWPAEMTYFVSGQDEEWQRSAGSLYLALALSIFLVYVIMAAQFESLVHPFVILLTIPLAFFGSVTALALFGVSLSIVVFLGMILLAGIVVNNAIVLVDYVNVLRDRGLDRRAALLTAGVVRLRPILMTTATTVLGLLPMALGFGDGAELRMPMALTVIAGLSVSTVLTLLVIPVVYDRIDAALARGRRRTLAEPETAPPATDAGIPT
jgi:HAE1 family hydrophobic/amphiphilic exporter-1